MPADLPARTLPHSSFGEPIITQLTPEVQIAATYNLIDDQIETFDATGGSVDTDGNLFRCQTGTSVGGYGVARSKKTIIYHPGEGVLSRFTGMFTQGVPLSLQFAGMFSLTETIAFGYDGDEFGVIHEYAGEAEIQTIQVTGAASGSESATITLDGDAATANLTNATAQVNAFEIARDCTADATLGAKWKFFQNDDKVIAISKSVGDKTGTMSFSSSTATATVTETTAGVAKTKEFVAQTSWNINKKPNLDPTKLNVYQVQFGYLGAADILFSVYDHHYGYFVPVHRIEWSDREITNLGNPSLKVGWTAASLGSSGTNLTVKGASASVFMTGIDQLLRATRATDNSVTSVGTTLTNLITIRNRGHYGGRFNHSRILLEALSIDNEHNKGVEVEILKNATVAGSPDFQYIDETNSVAEVDTTGTTVTGGTFIDGFIVGPSDALRENIDNLREYLLSEESITIAVKAVSGTGATINGVFTWREDI